MVELTFIQLQDPSGIEPDRAAKSIPEWYRHAERFMKDTGQSSFKNCMSFLDAMIAGYTMVTPCDIRFFEEDGVVKAEVSDERYASCIQARPVMESFHVPEGYYPNHFAWFSIYGVQAPEGYSALFTTPMNRFDLPFMTTSGIIESDSFSNPGNMPFFVRKGFEGTIPAGTPFVQIIPFKREDWNAIVRMPEILEIRQYAKMSFKLRGMVTGYYKKKYWIRKNWWKGKEK